MMRSGNRLARWWGVWFAFALPLLLPAPTHAEDRVIVRGNYYREESTRVLQPMVHVTVDAPDERLTIGATYLLDAISSASIASGTAEVTGGDNVFTELRHEATASVGSQLGPWSLGALFRYSTETDYEARTASVSLGRDLLQRSVNLNLAYSYSFDRVYRIRNAFGDRLPWCGGSIEIDGDCTGNGLGIGTNMLQVHYLAGGYTHALTRTLLGSVYVEGAFARGPQDNPYRGGQLPTVLWESHPLQRNRGAVSAQFRWHVIGGATTFEPRYRFSADDWGIRSHSIDPRVHFRLGRRVRMRVRYRFYIQNESFFWRDDMIYRASEQACTESEPEACASADPKMSAYLSHTPGVQLTYSLDGLARYQGLAWLEGGWIQATYNHLFQTNRFGNARVGSVAFSLAF